MTIYPATSADFTAATGLTAQWGRTFQEASGNLALGWGTGDLVKAGTPTFQVAVGSRYGISYPANGDYHRADINGLGTASGIYLAVCKVPTGNFSLPLSYKRATPYLQTYLASSLARADICDVSGNVVNIDAAATWSVGDVCIFLTQVDRSTNTLRIRISTSSTLIGSPSGSIAALGSLTSGTAGNWFGAGDWVTGGWGGFAITSYGVVITGTQCEGSGVLAAIAASLGWEGHAIGTLSATLGAATVAGTGTAPIAGALTSTLGAVTGAAAGAVVVAGSLAQDLGALTVSGAGTVETVSGIAGLLDQTLGDLASTAAGTVANAGAADNSLDALTGAAAGTVAVSGATTATLGESALAGAGVVSVVGAGLVDLGAVTGPLAGVVPVVGAAASTLGAATLVAVANTPGGALSATLDALTSEATGTVVAAGQLDQTLGSIALVAGNVTDYTGSMAATLGAMTGTAAATLTFPRSGTTTIGAIRDRVATILEQLTPSTESGVRFRRHREETDFRDWADRNPAACFRRFSVRATGSRAQPQISNLDEEAEERDLELVIAYPTTSRFGGNAALNRDDVIDQDVIQICRNAGTESYGGYASATVLTESTSRDDGTPTTFATVALRAVFQRAMP